MSVLNNSTENASISKTIIDGLTKNASKNASSAPSSNATKGVNVTLAQK
jgi:hypothetical protein